MQNITAAEDLQKRIEELEVRQALELENLKAEFRTTYTQLQPVNIIKSTIHDVVQAPQVKDDVISAVISLLTGYIAKRMAFGNSNSLVKKLLGDMLQLGVTTTVAKHPDEIKAVVRKLAGIAWSVQKASAALANSTAERKRLMKEILQLAFFIQSAQPQLHKILDETPLPVYERDNEISLSSLKSYRDSLKFQLMQASVNTA
jgi:hypothetical protein